MQKGRQPGDPPRAPVAGPTGRKPAGIIADDDGGQIAVAVRADPIRHKVFVDLGCYTNWLAMSPDQADGFADLLKQLAKEARGEPSDA